MKSYEYVLTATTGQNSSVGIAIRDGLDGLGIESRRGRIYRTGPNRSRGPPSLLYSGYQVFPGDKPAGTCS